MQHQHIWRSDTELCLAAYWSRQLLYYDKKNFDTIEDFLSCKCQAELSQQMQWKLLREHCPRLRDDIPHAVKEEIITALGNSGQ